MIYNIKYKDEYQSIKNALNKYKNYTNILQIQYYNTTLL